MRYLLILVVGTVCLAQTAVVIPLAKPDTEAARETYAKFEKAKAEWDALQEKLKNKYTLVDRNDKNASNVTVSWQAEKYIRSGFECGIEFSPDFSFAVPKVCPPAKSPWGNIMSVPAVGSGGVSW